MNRLVVFVALVLLLAVGCDDSQSLEIPISSDGSVENRVDDRVDAQVPGYVPNGEAVLPVWRGVTWCQPIPAAYDTEQIPSLPSHVGLDGFCDADQLQNTPEQDATSVWSLDPTEDILRVETVAPEGESGMTFAFDEEGRVRHVTNYGATGFYGLEYGSSWYDLNEDGEVVYKLAAELPYADAPEEEWVAIEKTQTWDGTRLLSRTERDGRDGPVVRAFTWTWQGDRVEQANLEVATGQGLRTYTSDWSYHESGAPASVERSVDGVAIQSESWTFDDAGALLSRTYWSRSAASLVEEHGGDVTRWAFTDALDSYQTAVLGLYNDDPWANALPTHQQGCAMLPRGPGHGYPDGESEYQLGVTRGERPQRIGFAYGNDSFAYSMGDSAWYGHDGLGTPWLQDPLFASGPAQAIDVVVTYNSRGVMVSEVASVMFMGEALEVQRLRALDEAGHIVTDAVTTIMEDDEAATRTLSFERDDSGFLIGRTLVVGDTVASQAWTRDDTGRVLSHTIAAAAPLAIGSYAFTSFGRNEMQPTTWTWRYDGELLVERGGGLEENNQTLEYNDAGQPVEIIGMFTLGNAPHETWTYDVDGQITSHCTGGFDLTQLFCSNTTYDSVGRVVWQSTSTSDDIDGPYVSSFIEYSCE